MVAIAGLFASLAWPAVSPAIAQQAVDPSPGLQRVARLDTPPRRRETTIAANPCLSLLANDPAGASDYAHDWAAHGGADDAAQCAALSDVALGDPAGGASALDQLALRPGVPNARRALLAAEAAQSWLLAGRSPQALDSAGRAVALDPANPDWLVGRGRANVAAGHPDTAIVDLSQVLAREPARIDALVERAAAYRKLNRLDAARSDIDTACGLMPDAPDALLERGIVRERQGDLEGARRDWDRILSVSPDTHEADLAQQDLALLDAGPDAK